jgi:YVTN family beta-propeller protein
VRSNGRALRSNGLAGKLHVGLKAAVVEADIRKVANSRRSLALFLSLAAVSWVSVAASPMGGAAGAQTGGSPYLKPVQGAPLAEVVIGQNGRAYATNPSRNQVEVLNLATGSLEAAIPVGSQPWGLDLSPDETKLYVANSGANDLSVVDLALRQEVQRVTVPPGPSNDRPFSLAVANTGRALVTTTFSGSGMGGRLLEVNFATGTVTHRTDFWFGGITSEMTRVKASGDRSRIGILIGNTSSGPVFLYDAATNTFTPEKNLADYVSFIALDGTGSTVMANGARTYVLDGGLVTRATVPDGSHGVAVNGSGTTGYRVTWTNVDVIDLGRGLVTKSMTLPQPVGSGPGSVALSADEATLVVLTAGGLSVLPVSAAVPVPGCTPAAPPAGVVAMCGWPLAEVVVDGAGRAYISNRARNQVEVVSLASGTREAPIPVGSQPWGLDLSPDETTLYVANSGANDVSVVDLASRREVRRVDVPSGFTGDRPWSLAVANTGRALLTTTFGGTGFGGRMYEIDFATGTVTHRDDFWHWGTHTEVTKVRASGDRSRIGIVAGDISSGPVFLYMAATDSFTPEKPLDTFVSSVALDGTGSKVMVNPGTFVLDGGLVLRATIPPTGWTNHGIVMNAAGTVGYRVTDTTVEVLDLVRALVVRQIPLPEAVGSASGEVALSPDETTLVVLTQNGASLVPVEERVLATPFTLGAQPSATPLDGLGTWIAVANDPAATSGQLAPEYLYGQFFGFTGPGGLDAVGVVALVTDPAGKFAAFTVVEGDGTAHSAVVPFQWTANRFYFPFVYQLSPGRWGAWVFDHTANAWTPIGVLDLPVGWGKLAPESVTSVVWYGETASACSAYPRADVLFYRPTGFVGGSTTMALPVSTQVEPADCPASTSVEFGEWMRYRVGE